MEWFAHSHDFESQVRVKTIRPSIAGLKGEAFASTNRTRHRHRTAEHPMSVSSPYLCLYVGKIFLNQESRDDVEKEK